MTTVTQTQSLPVLPLKGMVLFINIEHPVVVGRPRSLAAVEEAVKGEAKQVLVLTQRNPDTSDPGFDDLYDVGTLAHIHRMERHANDVLSIVLRGERRVRVTGLAKNHDFTTAEFEELPLPQDSSDTVEALHRDIVKLAHDADRLNRNEWPRGLLDHLLDSLPEPLAQAYVLASLLKLELPQQQAIYAAATREEAMRLLHAALVHEIQVLTLQAEIASKAASTVGAEQRQYLLRQQLEAIQKELGEGAEEKGVSDELRAQIDAAGLPEEALKVAHKELDRLQRMPTASQDYQLTHAYLKLLAELPWQKSTQDKLDLPAARAVLDAEHHGLDEVKDRIIEHLAVRKLNPAASSTILCLVGPPGVGKTSLGASIAKALGREFDRISLGGLHDEAELRGHRRTYVGAMPGRLIQALRRKQVNNPLILLDEIDKIGRDHRGDPAAALMEILDPSQNRDFRDNYLDLPFDLSKVFFVMTANTLDTIPGPLRDRMEILRLSGYTEEEKLQIARDHLLPAQLREVTLEASQVQVPEAVLLQIIRSYTREAGVRELNRQLARVVRKCAVHFANGRSEPLAVTEVQLPELLGPVRFSREDLRREALPGVATGLAWTEAGGDVLYIEAVATPGGKGLVLTGQLGEVMKESAQTAFSHVWSQAAAFGIPEQQFHDRGIHIHVPAGAIPKDGPSAGVTMATALVSLLTGRAVRSDTAMTGEITLAGLVLPVGGIKEKVLAARRMGIRRVLLPEANRKDLDELDAQVRADIEFIPVRTLQQVFEAALA